MVSCSIEAGTASLNPGTEGTLQAPVAITSVRQRISPRLVVTAYPSSVRRTDVTFVPARTGASAILAKRSMSSTTSPMLM